MRDYDDMPMFCRVAAPPDDGRQARTLRAWMAARLREDLADPVQVRWYRNRHVLTVMRGVEVTVRRRAQSISARGRCDPAKGKWMHGRLGLRCPLGGDAWAVAWWMASLPRVPARLRPEARCMSMADAGDMVNAEARHAGLLPQARRRVLDALQLDPGLRRRTRDMCRGTRFTTDEYSAVWCHARDARRRSVLTPELWPLYGVVLVGRGFSPAEPVAAVRTLFRWEGLSRRGWRLLCRLGLPLWSPLRYCREYQRNPVVVIAAWVNLVVATGRHEVPPPALTLAFGRLQSMTWGRVAASTGLTAIVRAAWSHMDAMAGASARVAFARGPLIDVLGWWYAADGGVALPRNVAWSWMERAARQAREAAEGRMVVWPGFGHRARIGGHVVEPLRSLHAVREAGMQLHNCMSHAVTIDAATSTEALFLIRDAATGHARAMFGSRARQAGRSGVTSIRATCNQPPTPAQRRVAEKYLRQTVARRRG